MPRTASYWGNGIVRARVPLGAGIGLAYNYNGKDEFCLTIFENYNMTVLWKPPFIFICGNSCCGTEHLLREQQPALITTREAILFPGEEQMECMFCVQEAAKIVAACHRSVKGAMLMQLQTHQYQGHSMSDPGITYHTHEETQEE